MPTPNGKTHLHRSLGSDFFKMRQSALYLSDGSVFTGHAPKWQQGTFVGEAVFNTGMAGYVESLTDPSYTNQVLVFTYPMVGNYGVASKDGESTKIHASGVIVGEAAQNWSHAASETSLLEWLHSQNIPILTGVDTRALTKHLRTHGSMAGAISDVPVRANDINIQPQIVSVDTPVTHNPGKSKKVILVDCGSKKNILNSLIAYDVTVKQVPYDYDYTNETYDGVLLSNGPGDPTMYAPTIAVAQKALQADKPVFGICLGSQLMGLAAGAKTYKLLFGHRGHNQPCMLEGEGSCFITSQNHGYALDEKTLPRGWKVLFRNLNDNSVEGIAHKTKPFFSVQFHPEARPGPTDTHWLFDKFYKALCA